MGKGKRKKKKVPKKPRRAGPPRASLRDIVTHKPVVLTILSFLGLVALANIQNLYNIRHLAFYIVVMVVAIILLLAASDRFLVDAKGLARKAGVAEIIIGLTIVSIGTSLPEIASTGMASFQAKVTGNAGLSDFALGNIYGSVLVQITFILGLVVLVKPMVISRGSVKRDGIAMICAVGLLSFFTMMDLRLDQFEAVALIIIYGLYLYYVVRNRHRILIDEGCDDDDEGRGDEEGERPLPTWGHLLMLVIGLGLVIFSSERLVLSAVKVAEGLGAPEGVIGLTVSAVGTSLPELAIALVCVRKSKGLAIGTLIGSNVTDPLLSIGVAGIVNPVTVSAATSWLFVTIIAPFTLIACIIGVAFMWSDLKIERWEGAVLVGAYILFVPLVLYFM